MLRHTVPFTILCLSSLPGLAQQAISAPPKNREEVVKTGTFGDTSKFKYAEVSAQTISTYDLILDLPNPKDLPNKDWQNEEDNDKEAVHFAGSGNPAQVITDQVGVATNALTTDFFGIGQTLLRPPDNTAAVGRDYIVMCVNDRIRIVDKAGVQTFAADAPDFFNDPNGFYFDPKVVYDPWRLNWCMLWHKWNDSTQQSELVMVGSDDSNPNGTWYVHRFDSDFVIDGTKRAKADYFDLGYSAKCLTIAGNWFNWDGTGFAASGVATFDPAQIYSPNGAGWIVFFGFNNADGTEAHTMRPAHMLNGFGSGWDQVMVNSARLGGDRITVWKYTDPLNTNGQLAITRSTITVNDYFTPLDATQEGSASKLDTIDCRLMPVFMGRASTGVSTSSTLWTGLNSGNSASPTTTHARLLVLDPIAGTKHLDTNFTDGTNFYWFPTPAANYNENCTWVFARSGAALFAEARFVTWDPAGGLGTSVLLKAGESAYNGGRWGDYFGGDLDWGDYYLNDLEAGMQKMWFFGEYAESGGEWGTWMGCTRPIGATPGSMSVSPAAQQNLAYYGGTTTPPDIDYTVTNSGDVSFLYRLRSLPSWLSATPSQDEIGTTPNTGNCRVFVNATGVGLNFGVYTDTFQFENVYSGALLDRTVQARVGVAQRATSYTIELGQLNSGGISGLDEQGDGLVMRVCKFLVPNQTVSPVTVRFDATIPGAGAATCSSMTYTFRSRVTVTGAFQQILELYNWDTNAYDAQNRVSSPSTSYQNVSLVPTGDLSRFLSASKQVRGRVRIRPVGPIANINWCADFDLNVWNMMP